MDYQHLIVTQDEGVVTVQLNRPEKHNSLNALLMTELTEFARAYRSRADVRAIVLTGGTTLFSAGADLTTLEGDVSKRPSMLEMRELLLAGPDMCRAWEEIEPVTIVAVEGYCVGGACALALACDFRVISSSGMMRLPEVPMGINMSWRSLPRLVSLVGPARAKRFTMFGASTDAATLMNWGMVDEVVEPQTVLKAAHKWAEGIANLPPLSIRMTKESINAIANANHHATSYMDRDQFMLTFGTEDLREGINAFFEKRTPKFKGN
mgnify:CR=1 FL=1